MMHMAFFFSTTSAKVHFECSKNSFKAKTRISTQSLFTYKSMVCRPTFENDYCQGANSHWVIRPCESWTSVQTRPQSSSDGARRLKKRLNNIVHCDLKQIKDYKKAGVGIKALEETYAIKIRMDKGHESKYTDIYPFTPLIHCPEMINEEV